MNPTQTQTRPLTETETVVLSMYGAGRGIGAIAERLHLAQPAVAEMIGLLSRFDRDKARHAAGTRRVPAAATGPAPELAWRTTAPTITARQALILTWIAEENASVPAIARRLTISDQTARIAVERLYRRLGVHNRRDATRLGRQLGLIPAGLSPARAVGVA